MRIIKSFFLPVLVLALVLIFSANKTPMHNDYESKWKQVDSLDHLRQPRSALEIVDQIHRQAKEEQNGPQLIKADLYRIKLMADFEEDYMVKAIDQINDELTASAPPEKQLLHSILGELYGRYYTANRYRILDRGLTAGTGTQDIRTRDAAQLLQAARQHYLASLDRPGVLKNTPIGSYDAILEQQKDSTDYRPTLFDFLAFRAIAYFSNTGMELPVAALQYRPDDPELFAPAQTFVQVEIPDAYRQTNTAAAIRTYRQVLDFHREDADPRAFIDADLHRLDFVRNVAVVPQADSLYLSALQALNDRFGHVAAHTRVAYQIARFYDEQASQYRPLQSEAHRWDRKKAAEICRQAVGAYPQSIGAKNCRVLLRQITQPSLNIKNEYAVLPGRPAPGLIEWKNTGRFFFRLVTYDARKFMEMSWQNSRDEMVKQLASRQPIKEWTLEMPAETDYQQHSAEFEIPALEPGFYVLLVSSREDFAANEKLLAWNGFWATHLSMINRRAPDGGYELYVLDRESGKQVPGVSIGVMEREYDYQTRSYSFNQKAVYQTDGNGYRYIAPDAGIRGSVSFYLSNGPDAFYPEQHFFIRSSTRPAPKPHERTFFFTDRSIYRPGQTVYFKGIILRQHGDQYKILPDETTTVELVDANGQKVGSSTLTTNAYGSVSGSFNLPVGVLNGRMVLRNGSGTQAFQVEEYKRPTFEVTFETPKESYRLGEKMAVHGQVKTYAGSNISGAQVTYRVMRSGFYPLRSYGYSRWLPPMREVEIASGETTTGPDGTLNIAFKAIPDYNIRPDTDPVFHFRVEASVTDINGETQQGSLSVSAGYKALFLEMDMPDAVNREDPGRMGITARNAGGEKQDVEVTAKLMRLEAPGRLIKDRLWQQPDTNLVSREAFLEDFPHLPYGNDNDPESWPVAGQVMQTTLHTGTDSLLPADDVSKWKPGKYKILLQATDAWGQQVETVKYFTVYDPADRQPPLPVYDFFVPLSDKGEPGQEARFLIGSAARHVQVLYEVQHADSVVSRRWIELSNRQQVISVPIAEAYRGNFGIDITFVIDNRVYKHAMTVEVPFTNKKLDVAFETFRSDPEPGSEQQWTITIRDQQGDRVAAEMLASMYDASLDAFVPHTWNFDLYGSHFRMQPWDDGGSFGASDGSVVVTGSGSPGNIIQPQYDRLNWFGLNGRMAHFMESTMAMDMKTNGRTAESGEGQETARTNTIPQTQQADSLATAPVKETFGSMPVRKNFDETAFFYPTLATDDSGNVQIRFRLPDVLTRWKFMGLAYTGDLMTGSLQHEFTASKKLMVFPNAPRFFRADDTLYFATRITNLSDTSLSGKVQLELLDAMTRKPVDRDFGLTDQVQDFAVEKDGNTMVSWRISVPENLSMVTYRVKATTGQFTDGEEHSLPVLPNRMMVSETMPMPVGGDESLDFSFDKLINSGGSQSLSSYRLTLEFASNPAWYAVQALPVIADPAYKNTVSLFGSFFANSIAFYLVQTHPQIKTVFESWKNQSPEAFLSQLEKNQELKQLVLEQTPWVLEAQNQSERRRRIALLFDVNNMQYRLDANIRQLEKMQSPNGGFPWYEGMRDSRYITQYVVQGLGRLQRMGVTDTIADRRLNRMLTSAVRYLDQRIHEDYQDLKKREKANMDENHLSAAQIQYLYARSNTNGIMLNPGYETAFNFYKQQAKKYWQQQNNYLQGMIALVMHRGAEQETAALIIKSLKERALHSDELGMYWRNDDGYSWYQAPIGTQSLLIEAFAEITGDMQAVEQMKIWLLKQKQTNDWKTDRATAEAVFALLTRGADLLTETQPVQITVGGQTVSSEKKGATQAGTGYFKTSWQGREISPGMGRVEVTNPNPGIAWGAMYWQYFEDLDKITPHQSPLSIQKQLFLQKNTDRGQVLEPLQDGAKLSVGDRVVVHLTLRTDRDMEFVHLKDMRAATFEPVNVLSGYRYQGGLGYYETTGDAGTGFFFDRLPKGTWVFEYPLRVEQKGGFSNGITTVQCMYAPEFAAHSKGIRVEVE